MQFKGIFYFFLYRHFQAQYTIGYIGCMLCRILYLFSLSIRRYIRRFAYNYCISKQFRSYSTCISVCIVFNQPTMTNSIREPGEYCENIIVILIFEIKNERLRTKIDWNRGVIYME